MKRHVKQQFAVAGNQLIEEECVLDAILCYDQSLDRCNHQEEELVRYFHVVEARQKDLAGSLSKLIREIYDIG